MKYFLDKWGGDEGKEGDVIDILMGFDIQVQVAIQYSKMLLTIKNAQANNVTVKVILSSSLAVEVTLLCIFMK